MRHKTRLSNAVLIENGITTDDKRFEVSLFLVNLKNASSDTPLDHLF
jgi:hypothetical protein